MSTFKVRIIPAIAIRGPIQTNKNKPLIEKYIGNGWVRKEDIVAFNHVDRVFYRTVIDGEPKAAILKRHIISPIEQARQEINEFAIKQLMEEGFTREEAIRELKDDLIKKEDIKFSIVTKTEIPIIPKMIRGRVRKVVPKVCVAREWAVLKELPDVLTRFIRDTGKIETFEAATADNPIDFKVDARNPEVFKECLRYAGEAIGMYGKRGDGYGKFWVEFL